MKSSVTNPQDITNTPRILRHDRGSCEATVDTLVIACGNTWRRDDGVGPEAASQLESMLSESEREHTRILIVHQLLPELALELAQANQAVLIDARIADGEPDGIVRVQEVDEAIDTDIKESQQESVENRLLHHWSFPRLLRIAKDLYGRSPRATVVSVSASDFDFGQGLSKPVSDAVPAICFAIRRMITNDS